MTNQFAYTSSSPPLLNQVVREREFTCSVARRARLGSWRPAEGGRTSPCGRTCGSRSSAAPLGPPRPADPVPYRAMHFISEPCMDAGCELCMLWVCRPTLFSLALAVAHRSSQSRLHSDSMGWGGSSVRKVRPLSTAHTQHRLSIMIIIPSFSSSSEPDGSDHYGRSHL